MAINFSGSVLSKKNNLISCTMLLNRQRRKEDKFQTLTLWTDKTRFRIVRQIRCTELEISTDVMLRDTYTRPV
jgi:hypothetical protein